MDCFCLTGRNLEILRLAITKIIIPIMIMSRVVIAITCLLYLW